MAKHQFQTEVNQLLNLIIHSLYSHKEIFLRELISNSSDALDKLKYLTLTDKNYKDTDFSPRIDISFDESEGKSLTVADNGVGMDDQQLIENLGTIARSGTARFLEQMTGDKKKDANLIGQFGVGFYSIFMVADQVDVISRKAGDEKAWKWSSDGKTDFTIEEATRESCGTTVTIYLNDEEKEFASKWQIENIVQKYSNHIPFPIFLHYTEEETEEESEGEEDNKKKKKTPKTEQINSASAIWRRPKSELKEEDYNEFFKSISHDTDDPLLYVHTQAEGTIEYTTLLYVPKTAPFDMYQVDYKPGVKLYVNRVFITDDEKELLPSYLRFVRGVIDSADLPLNVSREILQQNRVMQKIRNSAVKKLLSEFENVAKNDSEKYIQFIEQYNRPLKEGLYSDYQNRDSLLELVRFKSTKVEGWTSLSEYKTRMQPDQKAIYYVTGGDESTLRNSPLLEAYRKKDIEVLIMDDDIDEIVVPSIGTYAETELKSVNRSKAADDIKTDEDKEKEKKLEPILEKIKKALGDKVKDVVASSRLSESPSCIVADENDPTAQMQHMLKAMGQSNIPEAKPILEVNPDHDIVKRLESAEDTMVEDISHLLLDEAKIAENTELSDPSDFVKRLNRVLSAVK